MNNTSAVRILLIVFLLFIGCAQPQGTLPQYNQQLSIEEQKIFLKQKKQTKRNVDGDDDVKL